MFSKVFAITFLFAFFMMAVNCKPDGDSNNLKGNAGQGASGDIAADGGPSINVNPVNNANSESGANPKTSQKAEDNHRRLFQY